LLGGQPYDLDGLVHAVDHVGGVVNPRDSTAMYVIRVDGSDLE
jgi:hypothetical protein